jgi:hypothetical protein
VRLRSELDSNRTTTIVVFVLVLTVCYVIAKLVGGAQDQQVTSVNLSQIQPTREVVYQGKDDLEQIDMAQITTGSSVVGQGPRLTPCSAAYSVLRRECYLLRDIDPRLDRVGFLSISKDSSAPQEFPLGR